MPSPRPPSQAPVPPQRRGTEADIEAAIAASLDPRQNVPIARRTSSQDEAALAAAIAASLDLSDGDDRYDARGDRGSGGGGGGGGGGGSSGGAQPRRRSVEDEEIARRLQELWLIEDSIPLADTSKDWEMALKLQAERWSPLTSPRPSNGSGSDGSPAVGGAGKRREGVCPGCDKRVGEGAAAMRAFGDIWHRACFVCVACGEPIGAGRIGALAGAPAHYACSRVAVGQPPMHGDVCDACGDALPRRDGCIHFQRHSLFDDRYCPAHFDAPTPRCCGCQRLDRFGRNAAQAFEALPDDRRRCGACGRSAVTSARVATVLYVSACDFMSLYLGLVVPPAMRAVQVGLVELSALNSTRAASDAAFAHRITDGGSTGSGGGSGVASSPQSPRCDVRKPTTRGLTLSETRVEQAWDWNGNPVPGMQVRTKTVTAVLVLQGLPYDVTGSILAHEAMHVWLACQPHGRGVGLPPVVEEGVCQLVAWLFLQNSSGASGVSGSAGGGGTLGNTPSGARDARGGSGGGGGGGGGVSAFGGNDLSDRQLREFFVHQIEVDVSPVYGAGFRAARRAYGSMGLSALMEHVLRHKAFPA